MGPSELSGPVRRFRGLEQPTFDVVYRINPTLKPNFNLVGPIHNLYPWRIAYSWPSKPKDLVSFSTHSCSSPFWPLKRKRTPTEEYDTTKRHVRNMSRKLASLIL